MSDREISDAINKALSDHSSGTYTPKPKPEPVAADGVTVLKRIISRAKIADEADIWESSPISLKIAPEEHPALFLSTLFEPTDLVWIGDYYDDG